MIDAYLIYNPNSERSLEKANVCLESAKKFNINVTLVAGVYNNIIDTLEATNMRLPIEKQLRDETFFNEYTGPLFGQIGCTLSHHNIWRQVATSNKPCLVLEHDAEIVEDIESLVPILDDCIHLDGARRLEANDYINFENSTNQVCVLERPNNRLLKSLKWNVNCIRGTHGYLLSPKGARKLLAWAEKYFILPADWSLNNNAINLQYCTNRVVGLQHDTLSDSDTYASAVNFDGKDLQGFFMYIQKIDLTMLDDRDNIINITPEQNAKRKWAMYLMSVPHVIDNDEVYNIAMSNLSGEEIRQKLTAL